MTTPSPHARRKVVKQTAPNRGAGLPRSVSSPTMGVRPGARKPKPSRKAPRRYTPAKVYAAAKKPPRRARAERTDAERAAAGHLLAAARAGADVRGRKVRRVRAAIKVRVYENDLKFAVAMERLLATAREPLARASPASPPPRAKAAPGPGPHPRAAHKAKATGKNKG